MGSTGRRILDEIDLKLRIRKRGETRKQTFQSDIDGSVQYFAVNPAAPHGPSDPPPALALSLHGAGVEAIGQADAYESKPWLTLVAPTNRRPFGFDWEDWGRIDALEVLAIAGKELGVDPQRTYLTGHSMGGHGAWQLGVTFPDLWAAVGPSAGWISFQSYGGEGAAKRPSAIEAIFDRARASSDTLAMGRNLAHGGVYILHGAADDNVPPSESREMSRYLAGFHHDFVYHEQPGAGHWWDSSDEPGADCVDWAPMFDFFARHAVPGAERCRLVDFTTVNPGVSARCDWATIEQQASPLRPSIVSLRLDPGMRRVSGTTGNVSRLTVSLVGLRTGLPVTAELDGQKLTGIPWPSGGYLKLVRSRGLPGAAVPAAATNGTGVGTRVPAAESPATGGDSDAAALRIGAGSEVGREGKGPEQVSARGEPARTENGAAPGNTVPQAAAGGGLWSAALPRSDFEKGPARNGPFKAAFTHRFLLVYGTNGSPEETQLNFAKARYDAETFWYRGNGSVDVIADRELSLRHVPNRSIVLYGNADDNSAWRQLLADSPIQVRRGVVTVGGKELRGDDLACLFVRTRPGSQTAMVACVAATGPTGMRLATRLPYFTSGIGFPDWTVISSDALTHGWRGVRAAGFFGNDWSVESGDAAWYNAP
jgi:poly(3-hydroxybutyrate) depolymerase